MELKQYLSIIEIKIKNMDKITREKRDELFNQGIIICGSCHRPLPLDHFLVRKGTRYGRHTVCNECLSKYVRKMNEKNKKKNIAEDGSYLCDDGEKVCARCGILKPLTEFYHDARRKDGHSAVCRECLYDSDVKRKKYLEENEQERIEKEERHKMLLDGIRICPVCHRKLSIEYFRRNGAAGLFCNECHHKIIDKKKALAY